MKIDLALNNPQWLICQTKTKPKSKHWQISYFSEYFDSTLCLQFVLKLFNLFIDMIILIEKFLKSKRILLAIISYQTQQHWYFVTKIYILNRIPLISFNLIRCPEVPYLGTENLVATDWRTRYLMIDWLILMIDF